MMPPAFVSRTGPWKYQAWCPECEDGINGSAVAAGRWADKHNAEKHPPEKEES